MLWGEEFNEEYGIPEGRPEHVSDTSTEHLYTTLRRLDKDTGDTGALNKGIFHVKRRSDKLQFVRKKIDIREKMLLREIFFLKSLRHPNIIKFIDAFITTGPTKEASLYTEYCNRGNLLKLITKYQERNKLYAKTPAKIPESFIWHIFASLASALQYIQFGIRSGTLPRAQFPNMTDDEIANKLIDKWQLILHRDIKPENILLRAGKGEKRVREKRRPFPFSFLKHEVTEYLPSVFPRVVLADFGISTKRGHADFDEIGEGTGTPLYWPPELAVSSSRADIWTTGAVILSLCKLLDRGPLPPPPKKLNTPQGRYQWELSKQARIGMEITARVGKHYSPHLDNIVYNCMRDERDNRPFAFKLVEDIQDARLRAKQDGWLEETRLPHWVFAHKVD